MRSALATLLMLAALAACNPYDTDLGPEPFLCAATEPRCPAEYECKQDLTTGRDVCVKPGGSVGGSFQCADDSAVEPNDTPATATTTALDGVKTFTHDTLAICPAGDADWFSIAIATPYESIEALITYQAGGAALTGNVTGTTGVPIASTMPVTGMTGTVRALARNLPVGTYYLQVIGPAGGSLTEANYSLTINVLAP